MGEAFRIARAEMEAEVPRLRALRDRLWAGLSDMPELRLNGDMERRVAGNLNFSVTAPGAESLVASLTDVAISSASACSTGSDAPSHVLQALGLDAGSALRITVGRFNTEEEIDHALRHLREKIEAVRSTRNGRAAA